ncbi:hypothetical protein HN873_048150, partial [Arachis hypogaea]
YAQNLKKFKCKSINDNTTLIEMHPGSRKTFDLGYYNQVVKRRGLFTSDSQLLVNSVTKSGEPIASRVASEILCSNCNAYGENGKN